MSQNIHLTTHAYVRKDELLQPLETLRDRFTISSRFDHETQVEIFSETPTTFGFPLHFADYSTCGKVIIDQRITGTPVDFEMVTGFSLREGQKAYFDKFQSSLAAGNSGWLVTMETGGGKTILCAKMLQTLACTTLIIVPREHLVQQWIERLVQFTTLEPTDIGIAQAGTCDFEGKKVVVGMIHSLAKDKYPEGFKNHFGCIVWDECHTAGAQTFSATVGMFPAKYRIGMSATMNRKDGMERIYKLSIGQVNLSPERLTTLIHPKVYLVPYACERKNSFISRLPEPTKRRAVLLSSLAKDAPRNALIAAWTKKLVDSGRRTIVFSDRIAQLETVLALLAGEQGISSERIGLFTSKTKENDRKAILESSDVILATFGVMSMGVDVPDLRAIVFGTPASDVAQSVGRILRLCEGAKEPVVVDLVDTKYDDCSRWATYRQEYYAGTAQAEICDLGEPLN